MKQIFKVTGMTCSGCEQTVNNTLSEIKGVSRVIADREKEQAVVEMDDEIPFETFRKALAVTHYQIAETVPVMPNLREPVPGKAEVERSRKLVSDYITAAGLKQYDKLSTFLHHDFTFKGAITLHRAGDYIEMLKEHAKANDVVLRHDIKATFVDGNEACVIYEVVTNQPVEPVPFVEWVEIENGKILSTRVKFERHSMRKLMQELRKSKEQDT